MRISPGHWRRPAGRGFTLVELLLTVTLLLLMAGAGVLNFGSLQRGSQLDEGATQVESLFRFARAQASASGRSVRVLFPGDAPLAGGTNGAAWTSGPQVGWENNPLGAPGRFEVMAEAAPYAAQIGDLVRVRIRQTRHLAFAEVMAPEPTELGLASTEAPDATTETALPEPTATAFPAAIRFYPDGSSDSVEMILASTDDQDSQRLAVKLSGLTGVVRRRLLTATERELEADTEAKATSEGFE